VREMAVAVEEFDGLARGEAEDLPGVAGLVFGEKNGGGTCELGGKVWHEETVNVHEAIMEVGGGAGNW